MVPNAEVDAADTGRCPDDDELPAWVATLDVEGMAAEAVSSPDGTRFTVGFDFLTSEERDLVVHGADGQRRHAVPMQVAEDAGSRGLEFLRVARSRDGRLIAGADGTTQAVTVADAATSRVLMTAAGASGPVALDAAGRLVAYADADLPKSMQ